MFFIDIISPSTTRMGSRKPWLLVVEDSTHYAWSYFLKEKLELKDGMLELLKDFRSTQCIDVRYTHCDNAGESKSFEWLCKQEGMGIKFEYTMPSLSQQNIELSKSLLCFITEFKLC